MKTDVSLSHFLDGTVRLLVFVSAFYDIMNFGRTVVIVGLDYGIHPH